MTTSLTTPPTIRFLKEDPVFWKMMRTVPKLYPALDRGTPWLVWGLTTSNRWKSKAASTYKEAFTLLLKLIDNPAAYRDAAITCRPTFFSPPPALTWEDPPFEWCGRCRRPTFFANASADHHAMRAIPYASYSPRCYYCGINQYSMPRYDSR